jgi:hypothetical protein
MMKFILRCILLVLCWPIALLALGRDHGVFAVAKRVRIAPVRRLPHPLLRGHRVAGGLWPLVWLISLPFRIVGITVEAVFVLLKAMLLLPARLLGYRGQSESLRHS